MPEIGDLVGGAYRVLGHLGSGAMGVVFLAEDEALGRRVAIKFIRSSLLDEGFRERFTMEARAMARVSHPNAIQIHAFGDHCGAPYFVMEYVSGVTLDAWMTQNPRSDVDASLEIMRHVCAGVAAIHAAETVHRDLKPSNIIMDSRQIPRVADLGLATLLHSSIHEVVGTPAYMAPEVAFPTPGDDGPGERADVYSLGCVTYQLLTGQTPFVARSDRAMMFQHAGVTVTPPSALRAGISRSMDQAVLGALEKLPADRTPTVEAFGVALLGARSDARGPARILIADDNDDFSEALASGLGAAFPSAEIECVRDGRTALLAFDRERPSVIVFDLCMPELDGVALARLLRARDPEALTPIIVLTGSGGPEEWALLSALGVDRLLVKPVALDDVVSIVLRLMRDRSKLVPPSVRRDEGRPAPSGSSSP